MSLVYISIGSNLGDRFDNIQKCINLSNEKLGKVLKISSIYESDSIGFKGKKFFNACFSIETSLSPEKLLKNILLIETKFGRVRTNDNKYRNRTIDLDILFYDDLMIDTKNLKIPHSSMHKREFVLCPLNQIATSKIHPAKKKTVNQLLNDFNSKTKISISKKKLLHPQLNKLSSFSYISFEGIIGCGKTTMANKLSEILNYKLINERFADNPFLPKFYLKPKRYAFPLELSFLADRFKQIVEESEQLNFFKSGIVSDYHIIKSLIFSKITLEKDEFKLFNNFYNVLYKTINQPNICIYLKQTPNRALDNIKKRGRSYEQNISLKYLNKLSQGYDQYFNSVNNKNLFIKVDIQDLDFVLNEDDFTKLINRINLCLDSIDKKNATLQ